MDLIRQAFRDDGVLHGRIVLHVERGDFEVITEIGNSPSPARDSRQAAASDRLPLRTNARKDALSNLKLWSILGDAVVAVAPCLARLRNSCSAQPADC